MHIGRPAFAWFEILPTSKKPPPLLKSSSHNTTCDYLEHRLALEETRAAISSHLLNLSTLSFDAGVDHALSMLGRFVEADCCFLCQLSEDGKRLRRTHEWCRERSGRRTGGAWREMPIDALPWLMQRLTHQEGILVTSVKDLPQEASREKELWQNQGVASLVWVALRVDARLIGLIGLDASRPDEKWDLDIVGLLKTVSDCFANLITRIEMERALRSSEAQSRALLNSITESAVLLDTAGTVLASNETHARRLGLTIENLLGRNIWDLFPEELARHRRQALDEVVRTAKSQRLETSSEGRTYDSHLYPVQDRAGRVIQVAVFTMDVTELRSKEIERRQSDKLDSIGTLAAGIAHDFNNLLTIVMGNIDFALTDMLSGSELTHSLQNAREACGRANEIVQQFVTFSKGGRPEKKIGTLTELLQSSVRLSLAGTSIAYDFSVATDLWLVEFDESQMRQVINNLMTNASESMPQGGTVRVRAENFVADAADLQAHPNLGPGRYVQITIADQGQGIPTQWQSKVFDPYFSTKARGNRKGLGLGLSTAYSIIDQHGGQLSFSSAPRTGTTFRIVLPAVDIQDVALITRPATPPLPRTRILLMDDEDMILQLAQRMLSRAGFEVDCTGSGGEAVETWQSALAGPNPYRLAILDLTVRGGMGGLEAARRIRELDAAAQLIVSSGYSDDPVMNDYRAHGFVAMIKKPFTTKDLTEVVYGVLG